MAIGPGARVGPYEVRALLGEGGTGQVWRARHTALDRDDALKVLPDALATDPDRLVRFQREARVLASLNQPNIAHVYGLEQADGLQALVMELVEGPTLADRIAEGPISASRPKAAAAQRGAPTGASSSTSIETNGWSLPVSGRDGFTVSDVRPLFAIQRGGQRRVYDVSPDGQRILVNAAEENTSSSFTVVVNWAAGLNK